MTIIVSNGANSPSDNRAQLAGVTYSAFRHTYDTRPLIFQTSWDGFVGHLANCFQTRRPACEGEKRAFTPLVSPALFRAGGKRCDANVAAWGGWLAVDIDDHLTWTDTVQIASALGGDWCAYTTTRSTPGHNKQRLFVRADRQIEADEIHQVWAGMYELFGHTIDPQCKDLSRMYYVPANWQPHPENPCPHVAFDAAFTDAGVSVDKIKAEAREVIPPPTRASVSAAQRSPAPCHAPVNLQTLDSLPNLWNFKYVLPCDIARYLDTPRGGHHRALWAFMVSVAERAILSGYPITPTELHATAFDLDGISPIKTNPARWRKINDEAQRAIDHVRAQIGRDIP